MCDCSGCEQMMQPYLDKALTDAQRDEAEAHLDACSYCRKRYHFEETLRVYVKRVAVDEPMPPELKERLAAMRTPL